jgi:hypothetical protein
MSNAPAAESSHQAGNQAEPALAAPANPGVVTAQNAVARAEAAVAQAEAAVTEARAAVNQWKVLNPGYTGDEPRLLALEQILDKRLALAAVARAEAAVTEARAAVARAQAAVDKWIESNPDYTGDERRLLALKQDLKDAREELKNREEFALPLLGILLLMTYN